MNQNGGDQAKVQGNKYNLGSQWEKDVTQDIYQDHPMEQELKQIEDSLLEAWLNDDDLLRAEVSAISLILCEFWASSNQNESLNGDICYE